MDRTGTSAHFTVAGVLVSDDSSYERCAAGLAEFKAARAKDRTEFRFNQCGNDLRAEYLRAAARLPWRYLAVVLNKGKLRGAGFRYKDSLYKYTVHLLLSNAGPLLNDAIVVFDQCGSRDFKRTMRPYCMNRATKKDGTEGIKRVLARASHSDHMLQLADMVAGSVARSYKPEMSDSGHYRRLIRAREIMVQFWPT
jgi:hypothetical protein